METDTKTGTCDQQGAGSVDRTVRLRSALSGQFCRFNAGELVKIRTMKGTAMDNDVVWRVERAEWNNSVTIQNVLCFVPDHALRVMPNTEITGSVRGKDNNAER